MPREDEAAELELLLLEAVDRPTQVALVKLEAPVPGHRLDLSDRRDRPRSRAPEVLEPVRRQFRVAHRMLDVLVADVGFVKADVTCRSGTSERLNLLARRSLLLFVRRRSIWRGITPYAWAIAGSSFTSARGTLAHTSSMTSACFSIWKISTPTSEISTRPTCPTNIKFKHDGADTRASQRQGRCEKPVCSLDEKL
jgi:hypothetical protein